VDETSGRIPGEKEKDMTTYMPKQPKQIRERIEAKLERALVVKLERYCEYLESDRDYVIAQALTIVFKRDRAFGEWLESQTPAEPGETSANSKARR
jgi:hypothetical protein